MHTASLRRSPAQWARQRCAPGEPLPLALEQRAHDWHGEQLLALVRDDQLLEGEPRAGALARGKRERLAAVGGEDHAVERVAVQVEAIPVVAKLGLLAEEAHGDGGQPLDSERERRAPLGVQRKAVDAAVEQKVRALLVARRAEEHVQRIVAVGVERVQELQRRALDEELEDGQVAVERGGVHERPLRLALQQPKVAGAQVGPKLVEQRERSDVPLKARVHGRRRPVAVRIVGRSGA